MPEFYALIDAMPGQETTVEAEVQQVGRIQGVTRCKAGSHDLLVRFDAESFDAVDDFLQTHVRPIPGVKGVEIVQDWDDYGQTVIAARDRLHAHEGALEE